MLIGSGLFVLSYIDNPYSLDVLKEDSDDSYESGELGEKTPDVGTGTQDNNISSNPKTYDSITLYIVVGIISLGLIGFTVKKYLFR